MQSLIHHYAEHPSFAAIKKALESKASFQLSIPEGDFSLFVLAMLRRLSQRLLWWCITIYFKLKRGMKKV